MLEYYGYPASIIPEQIVNKAALDNIIVELAEKEGIVVSDEDKQKVEEIFDRLMENGDIYKGEYEGWYCTPCETYFTETQVIERKMPRLWKRSKENERRILLL